MVQIQVIFLFTSKRNFPPDVRVQVQQTVQQIYCNVFKRSAHEVSVTLEDSAPSSIAKDIILAIQTDKQTINEGVFRGAFAKQVAAQLSKIPALTRYGFSGEVATKNNLAQVCESEQSDAHDNSDRALKDAATDYRLKAAQYKAQPPRYRFDQVALPKEKVDEIELALDTILYERQVFKEWGLYAIQPNPKCALSFYGPPGTGKSMLAEAIASKVGKKIISVSYADIENKYVGEGPKNVSAVFLAAQEQDAVLFIDEAESLLSKRLVNVSDPSGQAMNSMRSQMLISLENFHGIVVFATNMAVNYDSAFVSRIKHIFIDFPDEETRATIWKKHLYPFDEQSKSLRIPLASDVDVIELGQKYVLCGRDIRNTVVEACVDARRNGAATVDQACLCRAAENTLRRQTELMQEEDQTAIKHKTRTGYKEVEVPREVKEKIAENLNKQLAEKKQKGDPYESV
ncbi:MAG: ATP-binding protein [Clostridiales bacterium]|nr:ATP-binding protein [Clostridiales bacterium]